MGCCSTVACRACATKTITKDKKCWSCGKEALSKDIINDEELRNKVTQYQDQPSGDTKNTKDAELMKPPATIPVVKKPELAPIKKAEPPKLAPIKKAEPPKLAPIKKAEPQKLAPIKKAEPQKTTNNATKREADNNKNCSPAKKKPGMAEVSLDMMKHRNKEFDEKMSQVEKDCKELRFGAQLELLFTFDQDIAKCLLCGEQFDSEKLTITHLQQQHKIEYGHLKTVLSPPNNNMLQLCLQKAIKSEFVFAKEQKFPVAVSY